VANNDTIKKTVTVALTLCVVCSVVVSTASVLLRPTQVANKKADFKRNILAAAHLLEEGKNVDDLFGKVSTKIVDLDSGKFSDDVSAETYDQRKASKDPKLSEALDGSEDIAGISRREKYAKVYLVEGDSGLETVILPIHGYGLWGTLYGFLALESDLNTVVGIGFYDHKETPGLGAEVDNPSWKASWTGKQIFDADGKVSLQVLKGTAVEGMAGFEHKIDGLSGATLTSKGVQNMMVYWFSENGYGPFLKNLKNGEV